MKNRIKELRLKHNLTIRELSKKLNIAESTLSHYENDIRSPDIVKLIEIAKIFNCTLDYLVYKTNTNNLTSRDLKIYDEYFEFINLAKKNNLSNDKLKILLRLYLELKED